MGQVKCHPQSFYTPWLNAIATQVGGKGCIFPNNTNIFFWPVSHYSGAVNPPSDLLQDSHPELTDDRLWNECIDTNTPLHVISVKQSDGWAYLALVNLGGTDQLKFSIDGHKMYVFAADGNFHFPQEVDVVSIPIGERFEVLVRLDQPPADYTIRVSSDIPVQILGGFAVLSYERYGCPAEFTSPPAAVDPAIDYGAIVAKNKTLLNALSLKPWPPSPPPQASDHTFKLHVGGTNGTAWALNADPYAVRSSVP
jgi:FtsP/CotA-like multicopper oxidase with cupredoxin domain